MHTPFPRLCPFIAALGVASLLTTASLAQSEPPKDPADGPPTPEMMAQMMELGKPGEQHKLLAEMVGQWSYTMKMWMDPASGAKPDESTGSAVRRAIMGGRYFITDVRGTFDFPGPDGKPQKMDFEGIATEAYDNVKKKFFNTWIDNMSTGIMMSQGEYDPATKTFTFHGEYEALPGMRQKIRELVIIKDKDHHTMEWYEERGGKEVKTMEIAYTRKK